jgi:hypothetical protein
MYEYIGILLGTRPILHISSIKVNSEISTQNRYTLLLNRQEDEESPQTSTHRDTPNTSRPPPIFVYGVKNFKAMLDDLTDVAEPDTYRTTALANDTVKISAITIDTYRSPVKHMEEEYIVHHTYQIKAERTYRIVIRHLHHSVPLDDIKEELQKEGHTVRNIMNIKHKQTKDPLSLFFVDLEPQANNKEIFNLQFFGNTKITIEAPHISLYLCSDIIFCVVRLLFVLFYVVLVCKCVLPPGDNPIAVNKYLISYHIIKAEI